MGWGGVGGGGESGVCVRVCVCVCVCVCACVRGNTASPAPSRGASLQLSQQPPRAAWCVLRDYATAEALVEEKNYTYITAQNALKSW